MAKWHQIDTTLATQKAAPVVRKIKPIPTLVTTLTSIAMVGLAAGAANNFLHGHVTFNERRSGQPPDKSITTQKAQGPESQSTNKAAVGAQTASGDLIDRYGKAATSPVVAAAIKQVEATQAPDRAKLASDRYEALARGSLMPGTDPMQEIMYGHVPPGMGPTTASIMAQSMPRLPRLPNMGPMISEPPDQQDAVLQSTGMSRNEIEAANQKMVESYIREQRGPIYMPPLHADHNWLAQHATRTGNGFIATEDHDGSIREMVDDSGNIVAQYAYDPWGNATKLQGSQESDFSFAGMYRHQRSELNLTMYRPYSPILGRWLTRDPLGEDVGNNLYAYVENDPINRTDTLGLQMGYQYGNWGGQGFANGQWQSEMSNFPRQGQQGWNPPINGRDWCYYYHDVCLHNAGRTADAGCRQGQRANCDRKLAACLTGVANAYSTGPGNDIWTQIQIFNGLPNNNPGVYYGNNLNPYPLPSGPWPIH